MPWLAVLWICVALCACADPSSDPAPGSPCAADAECAPLRCVVDADAPVADLEPLSLVCGDAARDRGRAGESCEETEDCEAGICLLAGACAEACRDDEDCGALQRCQDVHTRRGPEALQPTRACVPMVDLPEDATIDVEVRERALRDATVDIELDAPSAAGTTLYVLEHLSPQWPGTLCRTPLCVRKLEASGTMLFDHALDYAQAPAPRNPVAFGDHLDPAVIMLPIGNMDQLLVNPHVASIAAEQAGDLRITRLSRGAGGTRIDLNLFYVGAKDMAPEGLRGPPLIAQALELVDTIFAQADITIGDVRQIAVPGELPMRGLASPQGHEDQGFARVHVRFGVYLELPYLFRLSAGAANTAINLFFVADLLPRSGDGEPQAEAGGIPGPLGMHGTGGSGIAIATDMMAGDPNGLGRTLAHELAHYLGLFHTSEAQGEVLDPLDDTPECRMTRDVDGNGLSVEDCQGFGADNLMFWAKGGGTSLTAEQIGVLQRALILQ